MAYLRSNDLTFRWLGAINNDDNIRFPNYMYRNITGKIALNYNIHPNAFISFGTEFSAERINRFLEKVDQIIVDNYSKSYTVIVILILF